jgi:hypothetical protein
VKNQKKMEWRCRWSWAWEVREIYESLRDSPILQLELHPTANNGLLTLLGRLQELLQIPIEIFFLRCRVSTTRLRCPPLSCSRTGDHWRSFYQKKIFSKLNLNIIFRSKVSTTRLTGPPLSCSRTGDHWRSLSKNFFPKSI